MTEIHQLGIPVHVGNYRIDLLHRRIRSLDDREVVLTPGEFSLLMGLLERRGEVVARLSLLAALHPGQVGDLGDQRTVDTLVVRLRRKLECDPGQPRLIQTVYGKGYRLAAESELNATGNGQPSLAG
ncbi:winged helix-turn-helix domain-containing protein [Pseudomonas stutzeri]|nr:winged helix-turn-helix domain-containing protein [Stutzerimonas stutzeri]